MSKLDVTSNPNFIETDFYSGATTTKNAPNMHESSFGGFLIGSMFILASLSSNVALPSIGYGVFNDHSVTYASNKRRSISLLEARQMALAVLNKSDARRKEYAEKEASILSIWEKG